MESEINLLVGGEAGQGVQTIGFILAKLMSRAGLHVFADQDYESRVRGGHNFYRVRSGSSEVRALSETVDILIAVDQQTLELHHKELAKDGIAIFDSEKLSTERKNLRSLGIPLERIALDTTSNKVMANSVALGAAVAAAGHEFDLLAQVLREHFSGAGGDTAENNVRAARAGYDRALHLRPEAHPPAGSTAGAGRMLLNGNEAMALGAMAAGCKFVAAYPMTPASTITEYIASKAKAFDIVVIHPEDEIAAMNMAVGAAFTGVRAMTATSGDGFALMTEAFGLAGMTETPVVIVVGQRPGPAVGLPTRTEQGELGFVIYGGSGEFPRAVLAPCTVEDAFHLTARAFNLADVYQMPVIILTDQHLASSYQTTDRIDLSTVTVNRGRILSEEESNRAGDYKRHQITDSGISPRAIPMRGKALVVTDADEHDEAGHMIEDAGLRTQMMSKRLRKLDGLRKEFGKPRFHSRPDARVTLVGWGSTYGAISEAAALLESHGTVANVLQLAELWPFPADDVRSALESTEKSMVIENNATGQLASLIRAQTGIEVSSRIPKFDGRPFSPQYIVGQVRKEVH